MMLFLLHQRAVFTQACVPSDGTLGIFNLPVNFNYNQSDFSRGQSRSAPSSPTAICGATSDLAPEARQPFMC